MVNPSPLRPHLVTRAAPNDVDGIVSPSRAQRARAGGPTLRIGRAQLTAQRRQW